MNNLWRLKNKYALSGSSNLKILLAICVLLCPSIFYSFDAEAVPSFARQTSISCGACHAPPPELTAFGRRFMLYGYTLDSYKPNKMPVSFVSYATHTRIAEDVARGSVPGSSKTNSFTELQDLALIMGGKISDGIGGYFGVDYDALEEEFSIGALDTRMVGTTKVMGESVLWGIGLNNSPGRQDPWSSSATRNYPYLASRLEPAPASTPLLDNALDKSTLGISVYSFINDAVYLEAALYDGLSESSKDILGVDKSSYNLTDNAIYLRAAHEVPTFMGSVSYGVTYFSGDVSGPLKTLPSDYKDISVDLMYQTQKAPHDFTFTANLLWEDIDSTQNVIVGEALQNKNNLNRREFYAGYLYKKTYGVGVGVRRLSGSSDRLFFNTPTGNTDTNSVRFDVFWNPISKRPLSFYKLARTRIGVQYVVYSEFDGIDNANNFGLNRDASDNSTLNLYWVVVL